MSSERGQTTVEWTGLVLVVAVALGAMIHVAGPRVDGRSFGGFLAHSISCAVSGGCRAAADELARAHGQDDAALLRRYAPGLVYEPGTYVLPVDPRECRAHDCADAPDDRDLDVHASKRGRVPATAFTHVVRRGGSTYLQYWLYYPDSTTTVANAAGIWNTAARVVKRVGDDARLSYPGHHPDDWESVQVRIDPSGATFVRASSHHWYQGCKRRACRNRWALFRGWSRVSRGSHAGHVPDGYPGTDLRERTSTAAGLRLVPVAALPRDMEFDVSPPWRKEVYRDPTSNSTG